MNVSSTSWAICSICHVRMDRSRRTGTGGSPRDVPAGNRRNRGRRRQSQVTFNCDVDAWARGMSIASCRRFPTCIQCGSARHAGHAGERASRATRTGWPSRFTTAARSRARSFRSSSTVLPGQHHGSRGDGWVRSLHREGNCQCARRWSGVSHPMTTLFRLVLPRHTRH